MTTSAGEARPAERAGAKTETAPGSELSSRAATGGDADETAPLSGSVAAPPNDIRHLELEIERTRERLGETVQELLAKADVKGRALAKATEVSGKYKTTMAAMPDQARRAVSKGANGARQRWIPLAVAAGIVIIGCLAVRQWVVRPSSAARKCR
jgi:hypothetical protein